jgi:hypothetical protein
MKALSQGFTQQLGTLIESAELFRNTTRAQLQTISEATIATYNAVAKPGWQGTFSPGTQNINGSLNQVTIPGSTLRPTTTGNNVTINVNQTTQNPYTTGTQVAQAFNAAIPAIR